MKSVFVFCLLVAVALAKWREEPCHGKECKVRFTGLHFEPNSAKLNFQIHNPSDSAIVGGVTRLQTEGHGCFFTFCAWQAGPDQTDDTCNFYDSLQCHGSSGEQNRLLLNKDESRSVHMDFTPAVTIAAGTSGCCTNSNACGCMLRGTATMSNSEGEYAKVYMEFTCNLKTKVCTLPPNADEEL